MTTSASHGVRLAGVAPLAEGTEVVWSVADGRRGRRWRAVTRHHAAVASSLLLEVDPDGGPARLELATAAGLLTLHPEPTGLLHGNVVTGEGVRHLTLTWSDDHGLEFEPFVIGGAVIAHRLRHAVPAGEGRTVPVVVIGPGLDVHETVRRYERLGPTTWRVWVHRDPRTLQVDDRGLPVWPIPAGVRTGAGEWPLELDPQP